MFLKCDLLAFITIILYCFAIEFGSTQNNLININNNQRSKRAVFSKQTIKWTNGVIPYIINNTDYDSKQSKFLHKAIEAWENETCIQFRSFQIGDKNWVEIIGGSMCYSELAGMKNVGKQYLGFKPLGCGYYGVYLHELGHVIGLSHEHIRSDRDSYININRSVITPNGQSQFDILEELDSNTEGTPYDFKSIMHYGAKTFVVNKADISITTKNPKFQNALWESSYKDLSFWDVRAVNSFYQCNRSCARNIVCVFPNYVDKHCKCQTQDSFIKRRCFDEISEEECIRKANENDCIKHISEMSMLCRKTCNICYQKEFSNMEIRKSSMCKDTSTHCKSMQKLGYCKSKVDVMQLNCAQTCSFCSVGKKSKNP